MFESFGINVVAAIFYDAGKTILKSWSDPQVEALKAVYEQGLRAAYITYAQEQNTQEITRVQDAMQILVRDIDARYLLLDFALSDQPDIDEPKFKALCEKHSLEAASFIPFLHVFLREVRQELRIVAEDADSPLFNTVTLYGQDRLEQKVGEVSTELRQIQKILESFPANAAQLDKLRAMLSGQRVRRLETIRQYWNIGKNDEALSGLRQFRNDIDSWAIASPDEQAVWLLTEVVFLLEIRSEVDVAKQLLDQAKELAPSQYDETYIQSLVAFNENKYSDVLDRLSSATTDEAKHLKALALIDLKRFREAQDALESITAPSNIHVYHTQARLALLQNDLNAATTAIRSALRLAPQSEDLQFWLAQLKYYSILSPAIQPTTFSPLPDPISSVFYRATTTHRKILEETATIFHDLAENGKEKLRPLAAIWYLACLLNFPDKREDATIFCQTLINESPVCELAIAWAAARNLNIDFESAIRILEQKNSNDKNNTNPILPLVGCYLHQQRFEEAHNLLIANQERFQGDASQLWYEWLVRVHLAAGEYEQAEQQLTWITVKEQNRQLRFAILVAKKDEPALLEFLKDDFSDDPILLLNISEYMAQHGDWTWASNFANTLIEKIDTPLAYELAIKGTYQRHDIQRCLATIDSIQRSIYPDPLPWKYRDTRVRGLIELGYLKQAYVEAQGLYEGSPNSETFLTLAAVCQHIGDLERISVIARDLLNKIELDPGSVLKVAEITSLNNLALATEIWHKVMTKDMSDGEIMFALMLANRLGTKAETEPLFVRMSEMSQRGDPRVQMFEARELVDFVRDRQTSLKSLDDDYQRGELPVHIIAEIMGVPLIWLYHQRLDIVEETASFEQQTSLMVRHGGRPLFDEGLQHENLAGHLALDITSVIFQEHFGILALVEDAFAPIRLPPQLISALTEMLLRYHEQDREHVEGCKDIVDLANRGKLTVIEMSNLQVSDTTLIDDLGEDWTRQYHYAKETDGYFVNFLPVTKRGLDFERAILPDEAMPHLIDIRAIVEVLLEKREITQKEYNQVVHALGNTGNSGTNVRPRSGSKIVFFANTLNVLAGHDLLKKAIRVFEIVITSEQLEAAKITVNTGETEIHRLTEWVSGLIHRLSQGILNGKYEVLPSRQEDGIDNSEDNLKNNLLQDSLLSLFESCQAKGDVIVTDDRVGSSAVGNNQARVFTSTDLLQALAENQITTPEDYFHLLARIRRSNVRYVLYGFNEIMYHVLRNYRAETLTIEDSSQLATMRKYVRACVTQTDVLQLSTSKNSPNHAGERGFLELTCRHIIEAIHQIWRQQKSPVVCIILSTWILDHLYQPCRDIFIKQGILLIPQDNEKPFPELFPIADHLDDKVDARGYTKQERFRIWLWSAQATGSN